MIVCVYNDFKKYQIPNHVIGLGYIAGIIINLNMYGPTGFTSFIVRAVVPILILYLLFITGGLGAGDVKMLSVLSTMVGLKTVLQIFILSVFVAGIAALIICIKEKGISKRKLHYSYYIVAGYLISEIGAFVL